MDIMTVWDSVRQRGDWMLAGQAVSDPLQDEAGAVIIDEAGQTIPRNVPGASGVDLVSGDDLVTAVLISIFTDAQADPDDVIPDALPGQIPNRRGWWANPKMGSKIWLRRGSKLTQTVAVLVKSDLQTCLQWLIDDGVAASVAITTEITPPNRLGAQIIITKVDGTKVPFAFDWAWQGVD